MEDLRYLTDSYDRGIARIRQINAPLNFIFITDCHNRMNQYDADFTASRPEAKKYELAADHIRSMRYIIDRCPIDFAVCGGDVGDDYHPDAAVYKASVREVYDALYALNIPVYGMVGNHDDGLGNCHDRGYDCHAHAILPGEMHDICMRFNPTPENYYYADVNPEYRFVFLNSSDLPYQYNADGSYPFGWRLEISTRQADWFEEAVKTRRKVIVFSHAPVHNAGIFGTEGLPWGVKPYDDTLNAPRIRYIMNTHPNVLFNICGHVHYDNAVNQGSYVTVTTLCSLVQEWCPECPGRVLGTPSETAFDVFSIKDKTMYITRFGAGHDRTVAFPYTPDETETP